MKKSELKEIIREVIRELNLTEKLTKKQQQLDIDKDDKIDALDLKRLRAGEKPTD